MKRTTGWTTLELLALLTESTLCVGPHVHPLRLPLWALTECNFVVLVQVTITHPHVSSTRGLERYVYPNDDHLSAVATPGSQL